MHISAHALYRTALVLLLMLSGLLWTTHSRAACSVYADRATFNEYYFGNSGANFLEVYINNTADVPRTEWQNWSIRVYTAPGTFTDHVLNDTTATYCEFGSRAYATLEVPGGLPSPDISVALFDASGNEIDYLDACGPPGSCTLPGYYTPEAGMCAAVDHDLQLDSLGNRDISRFPDGSGDWAISSGTGAGTSFTNCETNNAGVSKLASTAAVIIGNDFTFDIEALNNNKQAADFFIEDTLPAGFTYVSSTATQGTIDATALPTLTWDVGSLAKDGGSATWTITVTGSVLGSHTNTATVITPCDDPANCPSDSSTVLVELPPTDHFSINHDTTAVNCQAEPVTISAHLSDHTVDTGYSGPLTLSTSSGNGDWTLINGLGALNNGAADDGVATYTMVAGDNGVAVLGLKNTHVEALNINVTDGLISEITGSALAGEDQDLVFAQSGFVFLAEGIASNITTQIGGKSSSLAPGNQLLELQAVRTSDTTGACEAALQGANQIELAFECRDPTTCSANQVDINGVAITGNNLGAVGGYTPVNLDFGDATDTTAAFVMNYPDVGAIQLYARYSIPLDDGSSTPSGTFITGNSNAFVVRPFGFDVIVTANPGAAGPADGVFTRAGADFAVSATAVLYQASDDALDNNGIPDNHDDADPSNNVNLSDNAAALNYGREVTTESVALTGLLDQPGGGNDPGLAGTTTITGFSSGAGNSAAVRFDEAGIIEITAGVADGDYLGIGAAATAALLGKSGYVGRFIPNHFVMASATLTNRSDSAACLDPFTYMGENFQIDYELAAFNARTPATLTQNYIGAFAKLDLSVPAEMNYGATDAGSNLTARLGVASAGGFVAGTAPVSATLQLARNAVPDGVYSNFQVGIVPTDSDGVSLLAADLNLTLDGGADSHVQLGQTDLRYGRLNLFNNFGSELLGLSLPLNAEYYLDTTAEFVINADDSCTTRTPANVLLYNVLEPKAGRTVGDPVITIGTGSTTLTSISAFVDGRASLSFTAPAAEGYVDIEIQTPDWLLSDLDKLDQGIEGPGGHCTPGIAASDPAYIAGCTADGNNIDDIPLSRGNFGIFKGSDNIIYIREVY